MRKILVLAMASALAGCATTEDIVQIKYAPTSASRIADARPVALTVVDGRTADRTRISTKINGYGMEMAAIRSAQDVSDVVREAAAKEFQQRGFNIEASGLAVTLTVTRFYNQYSTGLLSGSADGTVDLTVSISDRAGGQIYQNTYAGASNMQIALANGSNAAESVANALNSAFHKMFGDPAFIAVLTKAGSNPAPSS